MWIPGLIPTEKQGTWKRVDKATHDELLSAAKWDDEQVSNATKAEDIRIHRLRAAGLRYKANQFVV